MPLTSGPAFCAGSLVLSASAVAVQGVPDWDVHGSQVNPAESNRTYTSKWDNDVYYERSELNSAI